MLRVRLIGSNEKSQPNKELSNRDAIGTRVLVTYQSGKTSVFQKQAGEGFGSQNSGTLRIGCPSGDAIQKLDIHWPAGKKTQIQSPDISKLLTVIEGQN